ncbi:MAG: type II secretion system protein N [Pseudomonadales bacterium]
MQFSKRVIALWVVGFFLVLFFTMPAKLLLSMLGLQRVGIYFQGSQGYWHKGESQLLQLRIQGHTLQLEDVVWNVSLSKLMLANASAELTANFSGRTLRATISRSLFGSSSVSELSAMLNFDDIRPLMRTLIVPVNGSIELRDVSFDHDGEWITSLSGTSIFRQLSAIAPLGEIALGDELVLSLSVADDDTATGSLEANLIKYTGQFGLEGSATLAPNLKYAIKLTSVPDGTVEPIIVQQMGMIFGPPVQGQYFFEYSAGL